MTNKTFFAGSVEFTAPNNIIKSIYKQGMRVAAENSGKHLAVFEGARRVCSLAQMVKPSTSTSRRRYKDGNPLNCTKSNLI